jgi:DNA polymerase-1
MDLLIIDGRHTLWRAASRFGDLSTMDLSGEEQKTGGMYGFLRIILTCWNTFGGMTFVAWDHVEGPTARRQMFPDYKGNKTSHDKADDDPAVIQRREIVKLLREQELGLKQLLPVLGVRQADAPGWEADDVIATLCRRFGGQHRIGILSGDRDLLQLVSDNVSLIRPQPKGEFKLETPAGIRNELGLDPKQVLDMKALAGDASDNIPGARGIGPKTATKLIVEHGGWEEVLRWALSNVPKGKWHQSIVDCADNIRLSAKLVALNYAVPIHMFPAQADGKRAFLALARLKFNSLMADGRRQQLMSMGGGQR